MAYKPPTYGFLFIKNKGEKKTRLSPGVGYRDIISTSSTYNTGQTARAIRKILMFSFMVFSGSGAGLSPGLLWFTWS